LTKLQLHVLSTISHCSKKHINKIIVTLGMWPAADFIARLMRTAQSLWSAQHKSNPEWVCHIRTWSVDLAVNAWYSENTCDMGGAQNSEIALFTVFRSH